MSTEHVEINLSPTSGKAGAILFGKNIINLKDESRGVFSTDNLEDFFASINDEKKDYVVLQNGFHMDAICSADWSKPKYNSKPEAECQLKEHPLLTELKRHNNIPINLPTFTNFLRAFRDYSDSKGMKIEDNLNDLKIMKVVSIVNRTDNRGNFGVAITAESGKKDYNFPEKISFHVPMFQNNKDEIEVEFLFQFAWEMKEQSASLEFRIVNYEINTLINDKVFDVVKKLADESANVTLLRGAFKVEKLTNDYIFKESSFNL